MRKVIESRDDRTEITVHTLNSEEEKVKKALTYGRISGILALNIIPTFSY